MSSIFTRKAVADWFERHLLSIVGYMQEPEQCPLAEFVKANHPTFSDVSVDGDTLIYFNQRGEYRVTVLPMWAQNFVYLIDERSPEMEYEALDYSYYQTDEEWDDLLEEWVEVEVYVEDVEYEEVYHTEVYGSEALQELREATNYYV